MKKITLYSAATRNDGGYVDAGATMEVGDGAGQIDAARVKDMMDRGLAVTEAAAERAEKAAEAA